jgi:hypothetical protein
MTKKELYAHPGWQWCTFEGAELHTLLLGLETTFREKLEWLEEAETLALRLRKNREAEKKRTAAEKPIPPLRRKRGAASWGKI